jgi:uncharacterized protein YbjQ (UPF0145 family)
MEGTNQPESSYANNAMTRLWRNADDRETGAEAVVAIRARRQELESGGGKQVRGRRRFWRRPADR